MEHVATKDRFWDLAPAADKIFCHVQRHPQLSTLGLDFDYGLVDAPSARAVAKFSCTSCGAATHAVVWVTAATQLDGSWQITHSLQWNV
ncbi:hypothetical protein [Ramlibacter sp.]|uniref:hypothetical protein n=1 Tax=Ramlibacter sp. TaxID=1917967 RepID=UPI002CE70ACA|nr:hypothetical protein [Ramlibacter sp.]HWI82683.1 hypothetical protein [Ramlibacter sp.]